MNKNRFGRIGVLAGGPSSERGVSLKSGQAVYSALSKKGFKVKFIDVEENIEEPIKNTGIDVAFIALHGGFGEDGTVQTILERLKIPYTGSRALASRLALDKIASREIFIKNNLPVPEYVVIEKNKIKENLADKFKLPLVVKPQKEGSSIGLSIVREKKHMKHAFKSAFKYGEHILIEKFIDGKELTVGILDKEALPVVEILPKGNVYDYKAKYLDKETVYEVPAKINSKLYSNAQRLGLAAHNLLGCRHFSRVDMRMDAYGNIFILEVNTIPGLTERSLLPKAAFAIGINFNDLCIKIIEMALNEV